ncbi:metallophosphoesterase family protein [Enterocloster lavalensis]|uniref:metallophosphoesterase family protein n=1 Tax=Enterocloster lavalensis TaxID=460384 RepID=UPI002ED271ED
MDIGLHNIHRIAVISDTHGLLRDQVRDKLVDCEVILHGGDINRQAILDELAGIAPVHVVRGNNDKEWAEHLPETLRLELFGLRILMVHNKKYLPEDMGDRNLVIYGHSHKYEEKQVDGRTWLNPGSCGPRRFNQPITMAVVTVEEGTGAFSVEKVEIPHEKQSTVS